MARKKKAETPIVPPPPMTATLREGREWLRLYMPNGGAHCPCCGQRAQIYRRRINAGIARVLICMYRYEGIVGDEDRFIHTPSLPVTSHESAQAQWWRLIEEKDAERDDGGRAGWWRLTESGRLYVQGKKLIPKYARVFDGRLLGFDVDEMVDIQDALGKKFDLQELLTSRTDVFGDGE